MIVGSTVPPTRRAYLWAATTWPPSSNLEKFASDLESSLDLDGASSSVLLIDDFNAPCSSWFASDSTGPAGQLLELTTLALGLHQCVSFSTHLSANGSLGSLLDLVFVSDPDLITFVEALPPLGTSDHLPVLCHLSVCSQRRSSGGRLVWCYEKADFEKINKSLSEADWSAVSSAPPLTMHGRLGSAHSLSVFVSLSLSRR